MGKIISVIGNIGVGKTTLVHALAKAGDFNVGIEQHSNRPFQYLFKADSKYALANQIDYLLLRAEQEQSLRKSPEPGLIDGGLEQDFHGFTKLFKLRGLLNEAEFGLCERFYEFSRSNLPPPDLIIHLTASQSILRQRLDLRERINIANQEDMAILDSLLDSWLSSRLSDSIIRLDVSFVSPTYEEVLPFLRGQIISKLELSVGKYETDYIP